MCSSRRHLRTAALVALMLPIACGCAAHTPVQSTHPEDVNGRYLQVPWWTQLPDVEVEDSQGQLPSIEIPADALFDSGSAEVRIGDAERLRSWATGLAPVLAGSDGAWTIVGATDGAGDERANDELGRDRATAIYEVLETVPGMAVDRIQVATWGERCPAVNEHDAPDLGQARAQNRRVVILPPDTAPTCPTY